MANSLFDKGREAFLNADVDWLVDSIKCVLVDTGSYVVDLANHDFLNDIPVGARVAISQALSGKTSTAGVADSNDVTFPAGYTMPAPTGEAVVVFKDTGSEATSILIAYIDTATGLPITPNGADFVAVINDGPNKLFRL